jgi:hypothetical protein
MNRILMLLLLPFVGVALGGCPSAATIASGAGLAVSAAGAFGGQRGTQVVNAIGMTKEEYKEVNEAYTNAANLAANLFRRNIIPPSSDPDVQRTDICELVVNDLARISDTGGEVVRSGCIANHALDAMKFAFEHGDATTFATEKVKARNAIADMNRILFASMESSE